MIQFFRKHHYLIIISLLSAGYFIFLLQFYLIRYYPPDFTLYFYIAEGALSKYGIFVPHDGFSALFLQIAFLIADHPRMVSLASLGAETFGIFAVLYWLPKILNLNNISKYLSVIFLFSCGLIYYFYSKLFYDFPFTFATFGIALFCLWRSVKVESITRGYWFNIFWVVLGLSLSWKPYNIFLIAGFLGLLFCNTHLRNVFSSSQVGKWLKWLLYLIVGYSIGNYPLFYDLTATLEGLRAYPARSNPMSFFFTMTPKIIWDHVNMMPFHSSGMLLLSILLLVVATIVLKSWRYCIVLSAIVIAFVVFIAFFSPGLPWHGFPLALFLILYFIFLLKEFENSSLTPEKTKFLRTSIIVCLTIQFSYTYFWYIPKQIMWHHFTQAVITVIERERANIVHDIAALRNQVEGVVYVDFAIKRQLLRPTDDGTSYYRSDPLVTQESLYHEYYDNPHTADYIIYVEPTLFRQLHDVARVTKYDSKTALDSIVGDGYTISLYSNQ